MGGRCERKVFADREEWIMEVSDARLARYERLTKSSGFDHRAEGDRRSLDQQKYFADLLRRERERRS